MFIRAGHVMIFERIITEEASSVRDQCGFDIGIGLWLPSVVVSEVAHDFAATQSIANALR